ncbi:MAG TPA: D-alanine--D-alanine ligase family protein [Acidothermaceae bacterium]|nr:D-alanine--D-alanine ligase family protein [Acidothermaceae bacterium]
MEATRPTESAQLERAPDQPGDRKVRVAVLFGGRSTEHSISCITAGSVLAALDPQRYDVVPIGITREGRWVLASGDPAEFQIQGGSLPEVAASDAAVVLAADPTAPELVVSEPGAVARKLVGVDVVFPLLHGPYGEDGTIQGLLELAGIPYVGAGVLSSAAAMDKHYMKLVLHGGGLPDIPHVVVRPREWDGDKSAVRESVASLGFPVFVKPARGGSSIGISKVHDVGGLDDAIELARRSDPKVIVEAMVEGREIEVGVLEGIDGGPPEVSRAAEITVRDREFYDFDAKYLDLDTDIEIPASLSADVEAQIRHLAAMAFEALSCEGLARIDFFVTPAQRVLVNEVNTMPGFTPTSVFPRVWAASGLDYPALLDRLIQTALRRPTGLR